MVRIVQCLCPSRHAIMAIAYEPGVSTADKTVLGVGGQTLTEENAAGYLKALVEAMLAAVRDPAGKCAICGSPERIYDDQPSIFTTLEEAMPKLRELEEAQRISRMAIDVMRRARNN